MEQGKAFSHLAGSRGCIVDVSTKFPEFLRTIQDLTRKAHETEYSGARGQRVHHWFQPASEKSK